MTSSFQNQFLVKHHNFRFLAPTEIQFYGLRSTARFITTRKLKFQLQKHVLTIPAGFVADGFDIGDCDFCAQPAWLAFEYLYATHKYDYQVAERQNIDIYLYNHYSNVITVSNDELILNGVRISGEDLWQEALERGFAVLPEIVSETEILGYPGKIQWQQLVVCATTLIFGIIGHFIVQETIK